ncbi:acyl-CoA dehydrogenase family protein [Streptomyces sp. NPDC056690]|uniref:acyl-CoA dehydrogenase family protein n=1 Tax=unclassified Streptomyces TaxID=2593676 RepID=UPI003636D313
MLPGHWALLDDKTRTRVQRARAYLDSVAPLIPDADRDRTFPMEIVPGLLDVGFVRGAIPVADGGLGLSHLDSALLMEEAGRCWGSIRTTANILTLVAELLSMAGTDEQKQRFLQPLLAGRRLGWFAITEPDAGSDVSALSTRAEHLPDGSYRLTGRKAYITNASHGDFGIVLATVDPDLGSRGVTAFLVERADGYRALDRPHLPVRSVTCCDIELDGVVVPAANVLGEIGRGLSLAMRAVNAGRLNVSAGCTGLAQAALEAATDHTQNRHQFGRPLAGFQLVQQLVVDIAVRTRAARQMYQSAARLLDAGHQARTECSMAKYFCSETANAAATSAVQVFGAAGLMDGSVPERLFRDAREATIPEGTSQIQILQIGKELLGVSALR